MGLALTQTDAGFSHVQQSDSPLILNDIYDPAINLVIWQRQQADLLKKYCHALIRQRPALQLRGVIAPNAVGQWLADQLPQHEDRMLLIDDIQSLAEMYADLFDLTAIGLRLSVLDNMMCPRFHTDKVACRLVTTYSGAGSEWLPENSVNRKMLGAGAQGLTDNVSGIYGHTTDIQPIETGHIALMKGDGWQDSAVKGIVHRSPQVNLGEKRVILTFDFAA